LRGPDAHSFTKYTDVEINHRHSDLDDEDALYSQGYWGYVRDTFADRQDRPSLLTTAQSVLPLIPLNDNRNPLSTPNSVDSSINCHSRSSSCSSSSPEYNKSPITYNYNYYNPYDSPPNWGLFDDEHLKIKNEKYDNNNNNNTNDFDNQIKTDDLRLLKKLGEFMQDDDLDNLLDFNSIDYKFSKFKIKACKRDEVKMLLQNLEDKEAQLSKETIKSFNSKRVRQFSSNYFLNSIDQINNNNNNNNTNASLLLNTKLIKKINFLHFSNLNKNNNDDTLSINQSSPVSPKKTNLHNFVQIFDIISKLNKSINIFTGNNESSLCHNSSSKNNTQLPVTSIHAIMRDSSGLADDYITNKFNNTNTSQNNLLSQAVFLCSNIYETNCENNGAALNKSIPFGRQRNHLTMLYEIDNIRIGFMALVDESIFEKLKHSIKDYDDQIGDKLYYEDYILEANRLSRELRLCGANIIIVLANMQDEKSIERLANEANDISLVFSLIPKEICNITAQQYKRFNNNRWLINSGNNFDCLSLVSLHLDEFNSNTILDIAITKYIVD
jgi:hypothetical protein